MSTENVISLRRAAPEDYDVISPAVDAWWGRPVLASLPRLFFDLFHASSLVADGPEGPRAFLVGILSPSEAGRAYVHFAAVAPQARHLGLGRRMYETFFALARTDGRRVVSAVTSPGNTASVAFHRALGFSVSGPVPGYNGPGRDRILFERLL